MSWTIRTWAARLAIAMCMAAVLLLLRAGDSRALELIVDSAADAGKGTLRQAILNANANPGADVIVFNIAVVPSGPVTIFLTTELPAVTDPVTIDATSQPGYAAAGRPVVEVQGQLDPSGSLVPRDRGIILAGGSGGSTVRGLSLTQFTEAVAVGTNGNDVCANWIGIGVDEFPRANVTGVSIAGSDNVIGRRPVDVAAGQGNLISGNAADGVNITGSRNVVAGNIIGLDRGGTLAVGNGGAGVYMGVTAGANVVGGTNVLDRNVISANGSGVYADSTSIANSILGNYIGTNAAGDDPVGNDDGIVLEDSAATIGGTAAGAGNLISGNDGAGISIFNSGGTVIQGNRIGPDASGTNPLGNGGAGISIDGGTDYLIGGTAAGAGNVISGNGVIIRGSFTPSTGVLAVRVTDLRIQGNVIGTTPDTLTALPNAAGVAIAETSNVLIGGPAAGAGNVISGNQDAGVSVRCGEVAPNLTTIQGNRVGTARSGLTQVANLGDGIEILCSRNTTVGGTNAGEGNLISGNGGAGIFDDGTGDVIWGNSIGVDATGGAMGNDGSGVYVGSSFPEVGGATPGAGNTIAFNGGAGVTIDVGAGNPVRLNRIFANGGLGIDLGDDGTTANDPGDADTGPNDLQNFPVISTVTSTGGVWTASFTLDSPGQFVIDFYGNATSDAEGQTPIGSTTVDTGASAGPYTATGLAVDPMQRFITATATHTTLLNTSELSPAVVATFPVTISTQASPAVPVGGVISDTASLAGDFTAGTITFRVYGPNDAACASPPAATASVPVVLGTSVYGSPTFTTGAAGTYRWVADYQVGGVSMATGKCNDTNENVVVTPAAPAVTTQASAGATLGGAVIDTATVAGGFNPGGTITFALYGPNDATCATPPAFTSVRPVAGNGAVVSAPFTPATAGTYRWVASYSGDANNAPVAGACNAPNESVVVSPTPTTTTSSTTSTSTTVAPTTTSTTVAPTTTSTTNATQIILLVDTTTTSVTTPTVTTTVRTTPIPTTATTVAPTTTRPTTSTTASTTTVPPTTVPPTTVPPTTVPPTTVPPTTTTAPTTTTTTLPPPPPGPSLDARNPDGERNGPPGVGLDVSGEGYEDCDTVYFFFDGVRIGSDTPDRAGRVGVGNLSVPGDADPGEHRVTSACRPSGGPLRASNAFLVTDAKVHRSAIATSLASPDQVSLDPERLATSAVVAIAFLLLFAFPFELFNSTVEENYDEIRGWFRLPPRLVGAGSRAGRIATFGGLTVATAVIVGFLSPDFGLNMNSLVLVIGFTVALLVMSVGFSLPADVGIHRRTGEWGKLNFLPGTVLVSIAMVALSRAFHFQPGYMYGALAGLAFASALTRADQGRLTAANWVFALVLSVGAWLARMPVSEAAARPDANVWWIGLEAFLVLVFLWGVEGLVVAMLPMRFLDGRKVIDWNRTIWAVLMFLGVFVAVHVLMSPTSGYVGHTTGEVTIGVVALFLIFGGISVGLWAYFRFRPRHLVPRVTR